MKLRLTLALILSAAVAFSAAGCGALSKKKDKKNGEGDQAPPPVPVKVQAVGRATLKRTMVLFGSVQPESQVRLFSKVAGRIEELTADTCDEVKKGQAVARIDRDLLAAGLKQAEAARQVAAADIKSAQTALDDAERDAKRAEDLFKQGAFNEQLRDKARTTLEIARNNREMAASRLVQAEAAVTTARVGFDEAEIRATIDGTVTHRALDKGDFVNPGQWLFTVQDLRTVRVLASVPQADLPMLVPGVSRARVAVEGVEGTFEAVVSKIEPALDPATLSAPIELRVENRRRAPPAGSAAQNVRARSWVLASGMGARIELDIEEHQDAAALPLEAVRNDGHKDFVFTPDLRKIELEVACQLPAGADPYGAAGLRAFVATKEGAELQAVVLGVSEPRDVLQEQVPAGQKNKPAKGQLVTLKVSEPRSLRGRYALSLDSELQVSLSNSANKPLELARAGLGPERAGAAPYKPLNWRVRRQDVKLGKLGANIGEMARLVELLEPRDLVGRQVVVQGVTRLTDGSRVLIGEVPGAGAPNNSKESPRP